jgi:Peptidase family M28/PDZ domain/PA domain
MAMRDAWRLKWLAAGLMAAVVVGPLGAADQGVETRMRRDITFLASDECEGRGVDTKGIDKAAAYIVVAFKEAGLKPGGPDGSYFQPFTIRGRALLQGSPTVRLRGPLGQEIELKAGDDFNVLGLSGSGKLTAPLVFAGFGATVPEEKYDDYQGIDVGGKVVLLIRKLPRYTSTAVPFGKDRKDDYASFLSKVANAEQHKAAAVLIVNDNGDSASGDALLKFADLTQGVSSARVPVFHVRRSLAESILRSSLGASLAEVQRDIEHDLKPRSAALPGWTASVEAHVGRQNIQARNIIGVLEGVGPLAEETVVVGAHYDHLGYGGNGSGSRNPKLKAIHHGADDNGSGTTTVMELARHFGKLAKETGVGPFATARRRLVFMAFSGEERGLLGSAYYCNENPLFPLDQTVAMVNLDMVGRMATDDETHKGKLLVEAVGTAKEFEPLIDEINKNYDFSLKKSKSFIPNSDHASFYRKKVPAVFLWTGMHKDYHLPSDTADKINVIGMAKVAGMAEDVLLRLATDKQRPHYEEVQIVSGMMRSGTPILGFTPGNYGETEKGVLVAEVRKDGPAAKAGVVAGDMIISVDGQPIRDMGGYMTVMNRQRRGRPLEMVVLRNGKNVTLTVTPQ